MASQFLWTSKSVDLLQEHSRKRSSIEAAEGMSLTYYAGKSSTFSAVATTAHCAMVG